MIDTKGEFYLGRIVDPKNGKTTDEPLLYDPADLTTHAFVVGMTGSGKTGLCVDLLEEAILNDLPALMIDPKGDITNLLLNFPELLPKDFQSWVNIDQARREGKTVEQAAEETAGMWKKGLADWDIQPERLQQLKDSAHLAIFTPGSDAGISVSILASLQAPAIPWEDNREILRERISSTVTALLGLVGLNNIDPVRSREHILLANIFEHAWSQGLDLNLGELILQAQSPPFQKLGVFDVNTFFPQKDRFELAMLLNNILAAPAFQSWIEGQPLDIASLLFTADHKPRQSIFYIAHLPESERMFFITLLFSAIETWMRAQKGTTSLRALVYFDEIFGYLPPVANPPSKEPMLRMLKQARAFGVGLVLVTQNPVDVDYKGISNMGSWFIGKLQTDQDKQRLLDGLEGAMSGSLDRASYDRMISGLGKRVFLLHNVHNKQPLLMQTRWAMSYLAGPLARNQISAANALSGMAAKSKELNRDAQKTSSGSQESPRSSERRGAKTSSPTLTGMSTTRPAVPTGTAEFFLPNNRTLAQAAKDAGVELSKGSQGLVYQPVLLAQARVLLLDRKYNLDYEKVLSALVKDPDRRGSLRWEDYPTAPVDPSQLDVKPEPDAHFRSLEMPLTDAKMLSALEKDFSEWVFHSSRVTVKANEDLKVYAGPDTSQGEYREQVGEAARKLRDAEIEKYSKTIDRKISSLEEKLKREERELDQDETKHSQRKMEEMGSAAESIFGLFTGKKSSRRVTSSLTKRRMTAEAKASVEELLEVIADLKKQIDDLEKERSQEIEGIGNRWSDVTSRIEEITVSPVKKNINVELFGIAWFPYYLIKSGEQESELPAYKAD